MNVPSCSVDSFCDTMKEALKETPSVGRRGFSEVSTVSIKTGVWRMIGVRYCATDRRADHGTMLNFCPFCGSRIQFWDKAAA